MEKQQILPIRHFGNDLFADFYCDCFDPKRKGTPLAKIIKTKISLSGYNDNYFFEVVNKDPQIRICECGRSYHIQWKRTGVEVNYKGKLKTIK